MEHIHGIDVSWMSHGSPKDKKPAPRRRNTLPSQPTTPPLSSSPPTSPGAASPSPASAENTANASPNPQSPPQPVSIQKLQRRPSWFSNISSKFSSGPGSSPPQTNQTPPKHAELSIPRANPSKNAVLQHAAKYEGEGPYIPAPPKSAQAGIFHVFRRLSTSAGTPTQNIKGSHGLVERRVLNVDPNRERCQLSELNQAKLRRVSFCVDVEIAPMPKYAEKDCALKNTIVAAATPNKPKYSEKGEGAALKQSSQTIPEEGKADPKPIAAKPAAEPAVSASCVPTISPQAVPATTTAPAADGKAVSANAVSTSPPASDAKPGDNTRKKEKKKKSEEERKARKERKRRLAEANGSIPMEIYLESDDSDNNTPTGKNTGNGSSNGTNTPTTPRAQLTPTTNPVRIYRRCCQLRETPILKKITEQLSSPSVASSETGVVERLDLTGYWMQLADLITLGDFLAVVPIREVILENCGLTDEGLRVILAGLLAARKPQKKYLHLHHHHHHIYKNTEHIHGQTVPVTASDPNGRTQQGGFVERLVLKNNKINIEGWRYICLFVYMCRSLKVVDLSSVPFPRSALKKLPPKPSDSGDSVNSTSTKRSGALDMSQLLAESIRDRLGGAALELVNISDSGFTTSQLGTLVDGFIKCGVRRLGLAHNDIDNDEGVQHVARYLANGKCEGLDLGGNDLCERLETIADAVAASPGTLMALSLADCHLTPAALGKLMPKLAKLHKLRFLDLSHNQELFQSKPSALGLMRRYLPTMESLKRLHLADVSLTPEQAIAIAEIIPEAKELAHISINKNPELVKLTDARTEVDQEQACALYASLLAATRLSTSLVAVDLEPPTPESTEIVRAMAKQVLAYCLRNVDRVTLGNTAATVDGDPLAAPMPETPGRAHKAFSTDEDDIEYPVAIQHLVGHNALMLDEPDDGEEAPDDDYVIGGTGVAQALECCLKNRGSDSEEQSGDAREDGTTTPSTANLPHPSKAKDMSKHLLVTARKIRLRLQPTLQRARANSAQDTQAYYRLLFLDNTLDGIIKRFEEEFPETRMSTDSGVSVSQLPSVEMRPHSASLDSNSIDADTNSCEAENAAAVLSDGEDDTEIRPTDISRSNSVISLSSKGLTNEEGRVLRAGHKFRRGWFQHSSLANALEDIENDPAHAPMLADLIHDMHDDNLNKKLEEKGVNRLFREDRDQILEHIEASDPEHWERFIEAQETTKANMKIGLEGVARSDSTGGVVTVEAPNPNVSGGRIKLDGIVPESAIEDDAVSESS